MSTPGSSLQQRYGAPSPARRAIVIGVAAALVLAFLGWLAWATLGNADPAVSSEEIGHEVLDDHTAVVTVRITYGDEPVTASCHAAALAEDKMSVGEVTYSPDPDEGPDYRIEIRTDRRATTVQWDGCTAEGQPRPH